MALSTRRSMWTKTGFRAVVVTSYGRQPISTARKRRVPTAAVPATTGRRTRRRGCMVGAPQPIPTGPTAVDLVVVAAARPIVIQSPSTCTASKTSDSRPRRRALARRLGRFFEQQLTCTRGAQKQIHSQTHRPQHQCKKKAGHDEQMSDAAACRITCFPCADK